MLLHTIKEGSTIIAPSHVHPYLRTQLLKHKNAIPSIRIVSLQAFLSNTPSKDTSTYAYYETLKAMKDTLIYNKETALSYSYIQEMMHFIEDMKLYGIACEDVLYDNPFQQENKQIIEKLYPIYTNVNQLLFAWKNTLRNTDFKSVYIYDINPAFLDEKIYASFIKKGASYLEVKSCLQDKQYYSALNQRQEIESIAQYIIKQNYKGEDVQLSLLSSAYIPYVHQIFKRYNIPYYVINEKEKTDILQRFCACINYYLQPNTDNLIYLFATHVFTHEDSDAFCEYVRVHKKTFTEDFNILENVAISNDVISKQEMDTLLALETKARLVKESVQNDMDSIFAHEDCLSFVLAVDAHLCATHPFESMMDREALLQIRSEIKKAQKYLLDKNDLAFFYSILNEMKTKLAYTQKGVRVSLLKDAIYNKIQFVAGCTQENFPAFLAKNGIFDENYYAKLKYPSLEERYAQHTNNLFKLLSNCESLLCFSPVSTIDGKACETSLEIEQFMQGKPKRYPLETSYAFYQRTYALSKEEAKAVFVRNNIIRGSISSLEKYVKCPYSYFLKYGLKIAEPVDYTFNVAKCGTLLHYVLEKLIEKYGKPYYQANEDEIDAILEEKIQEIILVYPNEKFTLYHLKKRLLASIQVNLEILKEMELHSSLEPTNCEYEYTYDFDIDGKHKIALRGIIDRIDQNNDFIRVIDYKSSAHSLKEANVFSAQQLQLMTYLVIAQDIFNKRPLGGFYYSLALPPIKMEAGKLKRRPVSFINYTKDDYYAAFLKDNRLQGWVCGDQQFYIEPMDDTGTHIVGVSNSKASGLSARTVYNFPTLKEGMNAMYSIIGKKLLSGNIACESSEGACTYCPYARICMNANKKYEKAELINVDSTMYLKGGRKDDSME